MRDTTEKLRAFEDATIIPLLDEMNAGAIRDRDFQLVLTAGSIAFLVNNADAFEVRGGVTYWQPLSVVYCDRNDQKGEVFGFLAMHDGTKGRLFQAEIHNCCCCVAHKKAVELQNAVTHRRLLRMPTDDPSGLVLNSWYVFRGAILPMLYHNEYTFMDSMPDRVRMQTQLLHQIRGAYQGVI